MLGIESHVLDTNDQYAMFDRTLHSELMVITTS